MTREDFVFLNVAFSLKRHSVASDGSIDQCARELILAYSKTQLEFFKTEGLLKKDARAWALPIEIALIMYSDFTDEGQKFIMTAATDKWLQSCDKKGDLASYQDPTGLIKRLKKFRETTKKR